MALVVTGLDALVVAKLFAGYKFFDRQAVYVVVVGSVHCHCSSMKGWGVFFLVYYSWNSLLAFVGCTDYSTNMPAHMHLLLHCFGTDFGCVHTPYMNFIMLFGFGS